MGEKREGEELNNSEKHHEAKEKGGGKETKEGRKTCTRIDFGPQTLSQTRGKICLSSFEYVLFRLRPFF